MIICLLVCLNILKQILLPDSQTCINGCQNIFAYIHIYIYIYICLYLILRVAKVEGEPWHSGVCYVPDSRALKANRGTVVCVMYLIHVHWRRTVAPWCVLCTWCTCVESERWHSGVCYVPDSRALKANRGTVVCVMYLMHVRWRRTVAPWCMLCTWFTCIADEPWHRGVCYVPDSRALQTNRGTVVCVMYLIHVHCRRTVAPWCMLCTWFTCIADEPWHRGVCYVPDSRALQTNRGTVVYVMYLIHVRLFKDSPPPLSWRWCNRWLKNTEIHLFDF